MIKKESNRRSGGGAAAGGPNVLLVALLKQAGPRGSGDFERHLCQTGVCSGGVLLYYKFVEDGWKVDSIPEVRSRW